MKSNIAENFFEWVTRWPKTIFLVSLLVIIGCASFIPDLQKDTRSDAFMPPDHPALVYREKVKETFGLNDPMVIAVVNKGEHGVFNPDTLNLVQWLSDELSLIDAVDPDRITSLATENNIFGTEDGMLVEAFFDVFPDTQDVANGIREAVMDFPLYVGSLVSESGDATLIVAELIDQTQAQAVYELLLTLKKSAPLSEGDEIHIAGEGAVSGYMGAYIDSDAQRLNPIAALIITTMLFIAFRTLRGALLPNLVVLGTVATALGMMAAFEVSFFVITNALPVVLIGIAVADSIHILSQYYEEAARDPEGNSKEITIRAMVRMWRPITLTTLTTMAGFLGLSIASVMPPMEYFGIFAMLGVAMAWLYSMTVVPALLSLLKLKPSGAFLPSQPIDRFGRMMSNLGEVVIRSPRKVLLVSSVFILAGLIGASKVELNEERITIFHKGEDIVLADNVINGQFEGAHYLDIVIETEEVEDLFKPEHLRRIEALQAYALTLPHVNGSTSLVDYLKQMNRSMNSNDAAFYDLPGDQDLAAQYFLLYSAGGDPGDFEQVVDYDYRLANVRVRLDTGRFDVERQVVEAMASYIEHQFNTSDISASLSGRVNVDYHWIKRLGESHFGSIAISLFLVFIMASLTLRSLVAGLVTTMPVVLSVLIVYAVMGMANVWLAIGTSMFAAIAIGLGVDFAIHTVERLRVLVRDQGLSIDDAIRQLYPSTGRALLFNFAALAMGFGVLITSDVVALMRFGSLVAVAVSSAFIASLWVLPALIKVINPDFMHLQNKVSKKHESLNVNAKPRVMPES